MYMCVRACVYLYLHICMYVFIYVCVCVRARAHRHTHTEKPKTNAGEVYSNKSSYAFTSNRCTIILVEVRRWLSMSVQFLDCMIPCQIRACSFEWLAVVSGCD